MWPQKEWFPDLLGLLAEKPQEPLFLGPTVASSQKKVFQESEVTEPSHVAAIQQLIYRAHFSREVAEAIMTSIVLQNHSSSLSGEVVKILPLVLWKEYFSLQGHYCRKLTFSSTCARNWFVMCLWWRVIEQLATMSTLTGTDLIASRVLSVMSSSLEICLLRDWTTRMEPVFGSEEFCLSAIWAPETTLKHTLLERFFWGGGGGDSYWPRGLVSYMTSFTDSDTWKTESHVFSHLYQN